MSSWPRRSRQHPPSTQNWLKDDLSINLSDCSTSQEVKSTQVEVEVLDDEVAIISSRTFAQARKSSQRNHSQRMHDQVPGESSGSFRAQTDMMCPKCQSKTSGDCLFQEKLETNIKANDVPKPKELVQSVPEPRQLIFCCPICMGNLIEPTSTKCGHIFCKECLMKSLKALKRQCPTSRQKVGRGGTLRVYLPIIDGGCACFRGKRGELFVTRGMINADCFVKGKE